MAKNNNLTDFLTDVANAIREKEGSTEAINPQDFSDRILAIKGAEEESNFDVNALKDVNFIDWDGTVLYAYTLDEIKNQYEGTYPNPPLPQREGMICQGWSYGTTPPTSSAPALIGAVYKTDNGENRFYYNCKANEIIMLPIRSQDSGTVSIDWGDSTQTESFYLSYLKLVSHQYSDEGDYIVRITSEIPISFDRTYPIDSYFGGSSLLTKNLYKVEIGDNFYIGEDCFLNCTNLQSVNVPFSVTSLGPRAFLNCHSLNGIITHYNTYVNNNVFGNCKLLYWTSTIDSRSNQGCKYVGTSAKIMFCSVTRAYNDYSEYNYAYNSAEKVIMCTNDTITDTNIFAGCPYLKVIDYSKGITRIPSIDNIYNSNPFGEYPDYKIIVPDALYDDWIVATNWSVVASHIVKASDYSE